MSTRRAFVRRTRTQAKSVLARRGARLWKRACFEKRGAVLVGNRFDVLALSLCSLLGWWLPFAFGRFGVSPAIAATLTFALVGAVGIADAIAFVNRTHQRIAVYWTLPIDDRELRRRDLRYLDHRYALAYPGFVLGFTVSLGAWLGAGARILVGATWGVAGLMASRAGAAAMEAMWRRDVRSVAGLAIGPAIGLLLVGRGTASRGSAATYVAAAVLSTIVSFVALRLDRARAIEAFARSATPSEDDSVDSGHPDPVASRGGVISRDTLARAVESTGRWRTRSVFASVLDRVLTDAERRLAVLLSGGELVSLRPVAVGAMLSCACLLPLPKFVRALLLLVGGMRMLVDPVSVAMRVTSLGSSATPEARRVPALVDAWPIRPRDIVSTMTKVELVRGVLASPAYAVAALALAFRINEEVALPNAIAGAGVVALLQLAWRPLACVLSYVFSPASGARSVVTTRLFDVRSTLVLAATVVGVFVVLSSNVAWIPGFPTTMAIALRLTALVGPPVLARALFAAYERGFLR